jgi:predicted nucleic acid-binding protein
MKLTAAISDTDILIHLFETENLHIIEMLFESIYVPRQVMRELQRQNKNVSYFVRRNSNQRNIYVNTENPEFDQFDKIAKRKAQEVIAYIDRGEAHCVGYSYAMGIPIVISNNRAEFEVMEKFVIPLNFPRILFVIEKKGMIKREEAEVKTVNIFLSKFK